MGEKRLTGGRNVLNWDKSSKRRGQNVLKMGAKRLGGGGRNVYGAKCPGAAGHRHLRSQARASTSSGGGGGDDCD